MPEYILFQAHHFLTLLDYDVWYVAVLFCGCEFRVYTVGRDREMSDLIVEMDEAFWKDHVETGMHPPIDGSDACRRMLERRKPAEWGGIREATAPEAALLAELREHQRHLAHYEDLVETAKNRLRESIGYAAGTTCELGRVSYKQGKGRRGFDADAFRADHPELAARYETVGSPSRTLHPPKAYDPHPGIVRPLRARLGHQVP